MTRGKTDAVKCQNSCFMNEQHVVGYCEMHIKGIQTSLLSFLLIVQFIEDTKVPILGWPSYMHAKRVY